METGYIICTTLQLNQEMPRLARWQSLPVLRQHVPPHARLKVMAATQTVAH